jgi:hypothetical protein
MKLIGFLALSVLAQDATTLVRETAYARVPKAKAISADRELVRFVKEKNQQAERKDEIQRKDAQWTKDKAYSLRHELTTNACATRLRGLVKDDAIVVEALLMDDQGALVCSSVETSDYYQGDEAKWQRTFTEGKPVFVDEPALDASTGSYGIQLSVPVEEASKRIGALTLTLKIDRKMLGVSR